MKEDVSTDWIEGMNLFEAQPNATNLLYAQQAGRWGEVEDMMPAL